MAARKGVLLSRCVPTSSAYKEHLVRQGIISDKAIGGMYQPIFLESPWGDDLDYLEELGLTKPRPWHGAPLATLRPAFIALSSARIGLIDPKTVSQLQTLRDLYFNFQNYEESSKSLGKGQVQLDFQHHKRHTKHGKTHDESNKRVKAENLSDTTYPGNMGGYHSDSLTYSLTAGQLRLEERVLGPPLTTEEKVQRYISVPHQSAIDQWMNPVGRHDKLSWW